MNMKSCPMKYKNELSRHILPRLAGQQLVMIKGCCIDRGVLLLIMAVAMFHLTLIQGVI